MRFCGTISHEPATLEIGKLSYDHAKRRHLSAAAIVISLLMVTPAAAQDRTPIAAFKDGFTAQQLEEFRSNYTLPYLLSGGDASVWWSMRTSEVMQTAVLPVRQPTMQLEEASNPEIGKITADTKNFGTLSLDDFMAHPESYAAAFIVVHKGKVVYETYPGMNPWDSHVWMSSAKPVASLVIDLLIDEGKIDQEKTIGKHMPEFRDTGWADIKVIDVLDMAPGLNSEENDQTRADPDSIATRLFLAEFGIAYNGQHEAVVDVLKDSVPVGVPGTKLEYGSPTTEMLVLLAEAVTEEPFSQLVDKHIWSKVGADGPLMLHLSPGGVAATHGVVSSRLRDLARFGMLYTPSWDKTASEQVVTPGIIERIRTGVRGREFYRNGFDGPVFVSRLNDDTVISNSRQWDGVWEDGDIWKSGLQSQAIYVSPDRDLVIAGFSTNAPDDSIHRFLRPIATSGLFDE
ncbi:serine hydrolase domain-containing protein [Ruegeria atlantica]|uniref:serine hydrolase domain-containing protein n=1 Tax=Ruegeria atlantica TaxID=81569 RepID=UPI00249562C6|nr:serine hydrolase domain-containing protein [Ruegeria atlantica]